MAACGEKETPEPEAAPTTGDDEDRQGQGQAGLPTDGDATDPGADASNLADIAENLANENRGTIEPRNESVQGADISWPQCPKGMGIPEKRSQGLPMPVDEAEFVIMGLTNGPGLHPQSLPRRPGRLGAGARADGGGVRRVASYPDDATLERYEWDGPYSGDTRMGRLRNAGYQQARFNLDTMIAAGLQTPVVWIDVEPVPLFEWSSDPAANAAVVEGAARGYTDAGYAIGIYSTPYLWETVVGDYELGGVPEWRAAGQTSREEALNRCGDDWSIQGGQAVLGQWVADSRDHNVTCPGIALDLGSVVPPVLGLDLRGARLQ